MELSDQMLDRIDRYLMGLASPEEVAALEAEINQDAELAAEVEKQRQIQEGFQAFGIQEVKKKLENIHQQVIEGNDAPAPAKTRSLRSTWIYAAAAAIVLLIAAIALWPRQAQLSSSELYASLESERTINRLRAGTAGDSAWQQAMNYVDAGQWKQAAAAFETLAQQSLQQGEAWLNAGKCYLKIPDFDQAERVFKQAQSLEFYYDQAYWLLAMTYLGRDGQGDIDRCKQVLAEMIARLSEKNTSQELLQRAKQLQTSLNNL